MRISDWSSDVCSSDLVRGAAAASRRQGDRGRRRRPGESRRAPQARDRRAAQCRQIDADQPDARRGSAEDRKSVVSGKSVFVRVDIGGRRSIKKKNNIIIMYYNSTTN